MACHYFLYSIGRRATGLYYPVKATRDRPSMQMAEAMKQTRGWGETAWRKIMTLL